VRLDAHTNKLTGEWPLTGCDGPSGLAYDVAGGRLFSVCDGKKMAVTDAATGKGWPRLQLVMARMPPVGTPLTNWHLLLADGKEFSPWSMPLIPVIPRSRACLHNPARAPWLTIHWPIAFIWLPPSLARAQRLQLTIRGLDRPSFPAALLCWLLGGRQSLKIPTNLKAPRSHLPRTGSLAI